MRAASVEAWPPILTQTADAIAKKKGNFKPDELQKYAVTIFISGLENPLFKNSLKQIGPKQEFSYFYRLWLSGTCVAEKSEV